MVKNPNDLPGLPLTHGEMRQFRGITNDLAKGMIDSARATDGYDPVPPSQKTPTALPEGHIFFQGDFNQTPDPEPSLPYPDSRPDRQ